MKTHNLKLSIDFCGAVLNGEKTLNATQRHIALTAVLEWRSLKNERYAT